MQKLLITVTINGEKKTAYLKNPLETLLDFLRRNHYVGVKEGCRAGQCGACTVIVDGRAVNSCLYPAIRADGKQITTIEGLGKPSNLHPIQEAFLQAGAVQCGYCTPGMILSTKALLDKNPRPTEEEIKIALDGNLCRCTGYVKIIEAVKLAITKMNRNQ